MATFLFWQKPAFRYPGRLAVRTAVLVPWFRSTEAGRVFRNGWSSETARYAPAAAAGRRDQLLALDAGVRFTHAVIALARPGEALLTSEERDLLWQRFRVPVFEQIVGSEGELLASECEAHDGLHVESPREWIGYRTDEAPCGCGKTTARLFAAEHAKFAAAS